MDPQRRIADPTQRSDPKYLTFVLGEVCYALPVAQVTEIVGMQRITPVPNMPDYFLGVMNLRGQVIPLMDVRVRFGMPKREFDNRTCVVVVQLGDSAAGLIVDIVTDILEFPSASISPAPDIEAGDNDANYIAAMARVSDEVKMIVNLEALLFHGRRVSR